MPIDPNNNSVNTPIQNQGASPVEPDNKTGKSGAHKVDKINPDHVESLIPSGEGGQAKSNELPRNVQPAEAKKVFGAKDADSTVQSPEEQLQAILSDGNLAKCYKSEAKDSYLNASKNALEYLQSVVDKVGDNCNSAEMATEFKKAIKTVRSSLKKSEGRDVSDLKVTVTTREGESIQLIPFKLNEMGSDELKELLGVALELTNDAIEKWSNDSDSVAKEDRKEKILNCKNKIESILPNVDSNVKEWFEDKFKRLEFPEIEIHFDAGGSRLVEKTKVKNRPPASPGVNQLDIASTGEFYNESVDDEDSDLLKDPLDTEDSHRQENTEKAKEQRKQYRISDGYEYTEDDVGKDEGIVDDLNKVINEKPFSSLEEDSNGLGEDGTYPDKDEPPRLPPNAPSDEDFQKWLEERNPKGKPAVDPSGTPENGHPTNNKLNHEPVLVEDNQSDSPKTTSLLSLSGTQQKMFRKNKLWNYMTPEQVVKLYSCNIPGLVTKAAFDQAEKQVKVNPGDDKEISLPTFEELEARQKQVPPPPPIKDPAGRLPKNNIPNPGAVIPDKERNPVGDQPQISPTETNLLAMTEEQKQLFREESLWDSLSKVQTEKVMITYTDLIPESVSKTLFPLGGRDGVKTNQDDIALPTFEELLRAKLKKAGRETQEYSEPASQGISDDKNKSDPSVGTNLLELNDNQRDIFKIKRLWQYLNPNQIVKLFRRTVNLISKRIFERNRSVATVKDDEINNVPLPTLEELEAQYENGGLENQRSNLPTLDANQKQNFKDNKLWDYLSPDQIVEMNEKYVDLIPKDVFDGAKTVMDENTSDVHRKDVQMPTYEELEAMARDRKNK